MQERVKKHQVQREKNFITIEELYQLDKVIKNGENYLIDCLSMWIMNILEAKKDYRDILENLLSINANIVFVLNDVSSGIIPANALCRNYIDASGEIGQRVAKECHEVYQTIVGLEKRLK
jgi:adenosylcobinamide kinase/adenosylcobinamide-phosphate guanylyltransferase